MKRNSIYSMRAVILIALISVSFAGFITPKTATPISLTYNNKSYSSDYTFKFQIQTTTDSTSTLRIEFPSSYASNLGTGGTCTAEDDKGNAYTPCTVTGLVVTVTIGELSNSPVEHTYTLILKSITNPTTNAGSGYFKLATYKGINELDYNDRFGIVGIATEAPAIGTFTATCTGTCTPSDIATYAIGFSYATAIPAGSTIIIRFPTTLSLLGPPPCSSTEITGIQCNRDDDNEVSIAAISAEIAANTAVTITFTSVTNPNVSGATGTFTIEVKDPDVNNLLGVATAVGPVISAGSINSVSFCPNAGVGCDGSVQNVNPDNTQYITVSASTSNNVPLNGSIRIQFPTAFTLTADTCQVLTGLTNEGTTEEEQVLCTVDATNDRLDITKFAFFPAGTFSVSVLATNPSSTGLTTTFSIYSYADQARSQLIDQSTTATMTIDNVEYPNKWDLAWSTTPQAGSTSVLTVTYDPTISRTGGTALQFIVDFEPGFSFDGSASATLAPNGAFPATTVTPAWDGTQGRFVAPTTAITGSVMNSSSETQFVITSANGNGILFPSTPGIYTIKFIVTDGTNSDEAVTKQVTVIAPTMTGSIKAYSVDVGQKTGYEISFTTTVEVPESTVPSSLSTYWGTIDVFFPTVNSALQTLWAVDLGTGLNDGDIVPCRYVTGIEPLDGADNLECKLTKATSVAAGQSAKVRITGFKAIATDTAVTIHIVDVTNPVTADITGDVTVTTYGIQQRVSQDFSTMTVTTPIAFYDDLDATLPTNNGRSPTTYGGDGSNTTTFIPNTVSTGTELTFVYRPDYDLAAGSVVILKFPTGFELPMIGFTCFINYSNAETCYTYPDSRWIIFTSTVTALTKATEYTFTIKGINTPKARLDPRAPLDVVSVLATTHKESEYVKFEDMSDFDLGTISPATVTANYYEAKRVDVTYTWVFMLANDIAQGGKIVMTFPSANYVLTTSPSPECTVAGTLFQIDDATPISCAFVANYVTISNFAAYVGGGFITVNVLHVLNPAEALTTGTFTIESYDANNLLQDGNYVIDGVNITNQLDTGRIVHVSFGADPSNGSLSADYTISFTPQNDYPAGTQILIDFPSAEFTSLASAQTCGISGGLTTIASCVGNNASRITVTTDEAYTKGTDLSITIYGLTNFGAKIQSGIITLEVKYSDQIIDESPDSEDNRRFTTTAVTTALSITGITYDIVTAAEEATYTFKAWAANAFTTDCNVVIEWPADFGRELSSNVNCFSEQLSTKDDFAVGCTVVGRKLVITGENDIAAGFENELTITVQRVMNPNTNSSQIGFFAVYVQCGTHIADYSDSDLSFIFNEYAAVAAIDTFTETSKYTGYISNMSINATTAAAINGADADRIIVDFPADYNIDFVASTLTCDSVNLSTTAADACTVQQNRILINGYETATDHSAQLYASIGFTGLENPEDSGDAAWPSIAVFESSSQKILSRSYPNTNQVAPPSYENQGQTVVVNFDKTFSFNRGTISAEIPISIVTGVDTVLGLTANNLPNGVTMSPSQVSFILGEVSKTFTLSATQDTSVDTYYLEWTISTESEDEVQSDFAPVKRTYFDITDGQNETITIEEAGLIPRGGVSPPLKVTLSNSCSSSLILTFTVIGNIPTEVSFSSTTLEFVSGETEKTFNIEIPISSTGAEGQYSVSLSGENASSYVLSPTIYAFTVADQDTTPPVAVDIIATEVSRTTVEWVLTVSEKVTVYYMLGLGGQAQPTLAEAKAGQLDATKSANLALTPTFGYSTSYTQNSDGNFEYEFTVEGLTASTPYKVWAILEDFGNNEAALQPSLSFKTSDRYKSASFKYVYNLAEVPDTLLDDAILYTSEILKISQDRFEKRTDFSASPFTTTTFNTAIPTQSTTSAGGIGIRGLQDLAIGQSATEFVIHPDPTDTSNITPLLLANNLVDYRVQLKAKMADFDETYLIQGEDVLASLPVFQNTPQYFPIGSGKDKYRIGNVALVNDGTTYACIVAKTSENMTLDSYHIINGLNENNYPCDGAANIVNAATSDLLEVTGLKAGVEYVGFVSATNSIQKYPDMLADENVVKIEFTKFVYDEDDWASIIRLGLLALLLTL